jgi:hypothetical protein
LVVVFSGADVASDDAGGQDDQLKPYRGPRDMYPRWHRRLRHLWYRCAPIGSV